MRKILVIITGAMLFLQQIQAQQVSWREDFDGTLPPTNWVANPQTAWIANTVFSLPSQSGASVKSYMGLVPNKVGDSITLETDIYNLGTLYQYVYLRFSHIAKVATTDAVRIEYRIESGAGMGRWATIPASAYRGAAVGYGTVGFNANSYPTEWQPANLTALPQPTWWKNESFDLRNEVGYADRVQFRFIVKHGNTAGTQLSYGYLLENFMLEAATYEISPPTVQFVSPFVRDTVYSTGPWTINAKVKTNTVAPIAQPKLIYTATKGGVVVKIDTLPMSNVSGDSLWKATIPQYALGTKVVYSITGKDSNGNTASEYSQYIIVAGRSGQVVLQDGGTTSGAYPFHPSYGYARSMLLFDVSEIDPSATGTITSIGMRVATAGTGAFPVKIWLKTVPASQTAWTNTAASYMWATETQGATLVYNGNVQFTPSGWVDVLLQMPYVYNRQGNLVVMFEQNCSSTGTSCTSYSSTAHAFYYKTISANRYWEKYCDNAPPDEPGCGTIYSTISATRPDFRIYVTGLAKDSNSAAIHSINISDTVAASPTLNLPIVVTVKNKGIVDLDSATISYSINRVHKKDTLILFNPALPWDFIKQITLGSFTPRANKSDTVVVWIKLPNGQYDSTTYDDTLKKRVYAQTDIVMNFTQTPSDTVYTAGPHEIRAKIYSLSGPLAATPALLVKTTLGANTDYDTLLMSPLGSDIYTVKIPQKLIGSDVEYAVRGTDPAGNQVEISGKYHIQHPRTNVKYVIVGTGTSTNYSTPINTFYQNSWTRQIYSASELGAITKPQEITHLAWDFAYTGGVPFTLINQRCYFKAVNATTCVLGYVDPVSDTATLVWQGSFYCGVGRTWANVVLSNSFTLPAGKNLMIYWLNENGPGYPGSAYVWNHTTTATNTSIYAQQDAGGLPTTVTGTLTTARANARFLISGGPDPYNSVAMEAINVPQKTTIAGVPTYVEVAIRNRGISDLATCNIEWTLNGVQQPTTIYTHKGLPEDFTNIVTLSTPYMPIIGKTDTIVVWVSMPNGVIDTISWDDTLKVTSLGCATIFAGDIPVGSGQSITTITQALNTIRTCGVGGDVTLVLDNGLYPENVDLSNINNFLGNYSLTFRSATGNRNGVIIQPTSGVGFQLNNTRNITIKDITIDVSGASGTYGIQFNGTTTTLVSNITINNCIIKANQTATTTGTAPIYKATSTGSLNGLTIKNCDINGGYHGIYLYGTSTDSCRNILIDSNTITNQYYYGTYLYYAASFKASSNRVTPRLLGYEGTTWYGMYFYYIRNGNIIGNRVFSNNVGINSTLAGICAYYGNKVLIANNEILFYSDAGTASGFMVDYPTGVYMYHNSIYTKKSGTTGTNRANYSYVNASTEFIVAKNNVFIAEGGTTNSIYALYFGGTAANQAGSVLDYNNYYSSDPTRMGYVGGQYPANLITWKANAPGGDPHSVNIRPTFVDSTVNLEIKDYTGLFCPILPEVTTDIVGLPRIKTATMGCHQLYRFNKDAKLVKILGVENGVGPGQTHYVDVVVENVGFDTIKSLVLEWFIGGNSINVVNVPSMSLALLETDTIRLGAIPINPYTYTSNIITAQVNLVNGGLDEQTANDTIETAYVACTSAVSGTFTVGASGTADFPDIATALTKMKTCGVLGKVTLRLENGTYPESVDFSTLSLTNNDTIEFVSLSGVAKDVILATKVCGIKVGNGDNILIKDITINLTDEGYGIFLGSGDNIEINGCVINLDTTISKNMTGSNIGTRHIAIYKPENSGISNNVRIVNNIITGGYNAVYIAAGDTNTYGTKWIFDSNTVQKAYYHSMFILYTDFDSISNNIVKPMTNSSFTTTGWFGMTVQLCNAKVIQGNKIQGQNYAFTDPRGMFLYYLNANTTPAKIYNNEILLSKTGTSAASNAITFQASSYGNIYHNSIYVKETAISNYSLLYVNTDKPTDVRNNNFIADRSIPININSNVATLDYNNYYTGGTYIGSYNATLANNINMWKSVTGKESNSVSVRPKFANLAQSMVVIDSFSYIACPTLSAVPVDINKTQRQYAITAMGAYELVPSANLTVRHRLFNFPNMAITNQTLSLDVEVINFGVVPISDAIFGYSFNNGMPKTYHWTPTPDLTTLSTPAIISLETLHVQQDTTVRIWIESVNGAKNSLSDTVFASLKVAPLAEFIPPVPDTLFNQLSFDVTVRIPTVTGAPVVTPPRLHILSTIDGNITYNKDVSMNPTAANMWTVKTPAQYYGSKVVFWLTVSDTIGNSVMLKDSVLLMFNPKAGNDTAIIGTGTSTSYQAPINTFYNYSWTRQTYTYREISPNLDPNGTYITTIGWQYIYSTALNHTNQTCYMRAVPDSTQVAGYIDPLSVGAKQVWKGTISGPAGWVERTLDTAFFLPAGMNLQIFWNNQHGTYYTSSNPTWMHTSISYQGTVHGYADGSWSAATTATSSFLSSRPNVKLGKKPVFQSYQGYDLALLSVTSPIYNPNDICEPDNDSVKVVLANLGNQDYDFSINAAAINYEFINPMNVVDTGKIVLNSKILKSGRTDTIVVKTAFPILAGLSSFKIWVNSPLDVIKYGDTIRHTYFSDKLGLPIDEVFADTVMPSQFMSTPNNASGWQLYRPKPSDRVQPVLAGTNMLRYAGFSTTGATAKLGTSRQIDMYGAVNPKLEFWYYHDTISELDNSYTDVNIIADGVSRTVLTLFKRSDTAGWKYYYVDLRPDTNAKCVLIEFESMNKINGTAQYIDHIIITSEQDLEVTKILVSPSISVCNFKNKKIDVVLSTKTTQAINLSQHPISLVVEIPGRPNDTIPLTKNMPGRTSDTISIATGVNFSTGVNIIKAYLTASVDNKPSNDIKIDTFTIRPALTVKTEAATAPSFCYSKNMEILQKITVNNTGNMPLSDIVVILELFDNNFGYLQTKRDTIHNINLLPGGTTDIEIPYVTPLEYFYYVEATAYLSCDSALANAKTEISECVDLDDISIVELIKPKAGTTDTAGAINEIVLLLKNESTSKNFEDVKVTALIEKTDGTQVSKLTEVVPLIRYSDTAIYPFMRTYTVPNEDHYVITVFLEKEDNYPKNDTVREKRSVVGGITKIASSTSDKFTLGQNIPNPAKHNTLIKYSVPASGEVVFNVHSITGQLLFTKTIQSESGEYVIELNTSSFAAGVYFYSIEYQGQKLTKRMSVRN